MKKDSVYDKAREIYENELEKLVKLGEINGDKGLEQHYKLLDCILDTYKICEKDMEAEAGYNEDYSGRGNYGRSYSRNGSYGMMPDYNSGYSGYQGGNSRGYQNGNSRNSTIDHLRTMVGNAENEHDRMMYQRWLDEAERNYR